jgi:hypothetical protein
MQKNIPSIREIHERIYELDPELARRVASSSDPFVYSKVARSVSEDLAALNIDAVLTVLWVSDADIRRSELNAAFGSLRENG